MSSIFEKVDRVSTGAKLFVVAVGLLLMLTYSFQKQPVTGHYRTQTGTPAPHVAMPRATAIPAPFSSETPLSPLQAPLAQAPSVGPTVEVRRALPPDVKLPTPKSTPLPATPSYPTPNRKNWPDGRMLIHPEHFVRTRVVNVAPNDTLELRSGPGTGSTPLRKIPYNGRDILAFDKDAVQDLDGKTWWYPVEWQGIRGYVGGGYLAHGQ